MTYNVFGGTLNLAQLQLRTFQHSSRGWMLLPELHQSICCGFVPQVVLQRIHNKRNPRLAVWRSGVVVRRMNKVTLR